MDSYEIEAYVKEIVSELVDKTITEYEESEEITIVLETDEDSDPFYDEALKDDSESGTNYSESGSWSESESGSEVFSQEYYYDDNIDDPNYIPSTDLFETEYVELNNEYYDAEEPNRSSVTIFTEEDKEKLELVYDLLGYLDENQLKSLATDLERASIGNSEIDLDTDAKREAFLECLDSLELNDEDINEEEEAIISILDSVIESTSSNTFVVPTSTNAVIRGFYDLFEDVLTNEDIENLSDTFESIVSSYGTLNINTVHSIIESFESYASAILTEDQISSATGMISDSVYDEEDYDDARIQIIKNRLSAELNDSAKVEAASESIYNLVYGLSSSKSVGSVSYDIFEYLKNEDIDSDTAEELTQLFESESGNYITEDNDDEVIEAIIDAYSSTLSEDILSGVESIIRDSIIASEERVNIEELKRDVVSSILDYTYSRKLTAETIETVKLIFKEAVGDSMTLNNITSTLGRFESIIANIITTEELNATKAVIREATIDTLYTNTMHANYAEINFANVNTGTIQEAWIKSLMVQGGIIAQAGTVYYLDAIHINANYIDAGTLKADRILLTGEDGLYYQINLNRLGEAVIESLTPEEQAELKQTIHADAITAHTITADHITVNNIAGTGGWINLANGTFEYRNINSASWVNASNGIKWDGSILEIRANQLLFTSGVNAEEAINSASEEAQNAQTAADIANDTLFGGSVKVTINTTGTIDSDNVVVDVDIFSEEVGGVYGIYEFIYTNGSWELDENPVSLSSYGITISDTPSEDDTISADFGETIGITTTVSSNLEAINSTIENTNELIDNLDTVTESLLSIADQTDTNLQSIVDLQGTTNSLAESISNTDARADTLASELETVQNNTNSLTEWMGQQKEENETTNDAIQALNTVVNALELAMNNANGTIAWLSFGSDEHGNPVLSIGGGEDASLEVAISNSQMQFKDDGLPVAWISGEKLYISKSQITEELRFGDFAFIPRKNGNLSLKYVGDES